MTELLNMDIPKEKLILAKHYPIQVLETIGVNATYQKLHWHDVLEINLIKSGTGYYIINGQTFEFQEGDILLINSNDLHCAYETKDLVMQVICFDASWLLNIVRYDSEILHPYKEMGVHFTNLLDRNEPHMNELRSLLLEIQDEHDQEQTSYGSLVYSNLIRFHACVNRYFRREGLNRGKDSIGARQLDKMRKVIYDMQKNFAYPWTLEELAGLVYLSPSRFSDIFRRTVGTPPLLYLIHIRLEHAVMLLETSDMKITEIALECGFRSLSNFNRLFKKHIGSCPKIARG
ncbi:AraC family transcriptional regulator [Paenibacillus sp. FSL A5-0031]|uniref:AraC family transcriptional regulator n=1 Tax=unclassified Paenibacillus TaxID=185978 RepID=UPI00096C2F64|nr:AraC family transcriptional regulator [Paenibacillus sp. FSL A5-0031]OME82207.1 AraC family transcriptional regulator [Paenibacillus sp. FSL A5-0031]